MNPGAEFPRYGTFVEPYLESPIEQIARTMYVEEMKRQHQFAYLARLRALNDAAEALTGMPEAQKIVHQLFDDTQRAETRRQIDEQFR